MINKSLKKIMVLGIVATSLLALNPIGASAEWKQDSKGWWYADGSSWYKGWKQIDEKWYYFNYDGYMSTNWIVDFKYNSGGNHEIIDKIYYYLNSDGALDDSKTTKTMPGEIKKVYDIVANFEQSYINNLYFGGINDSNIDSFYDNYKQFGFSNKGAYRFFVEIMGDGCDELYYDATSQKICIINQGLCIIFDSKELFDSNKNKGNIITKIREWQEKLHNSSNTILNVKENENSYTIEKYDYKYNNNYNSIQYDTQYSYNKENGQITKK